MFGYTKSFSKPYETNMNTNSTFLKEEKNISMYFKLHLKQFSLDFSLTNISNANYKIKLQYSTVFVLPLFSCFTVHDASHKEQNLFVYSDIFLQDLMP